MRAALRSLRARVLRLEDDRMPSDQDGGDDPARFDWFGESCPCGKPAGECREHPRARPSQRPLPSDWRTWLLLAGRGFGKMLDVDTPIPTPSGWAAIGALRADDRVFDESGRVCRVTFASRPERPERAYRLHFSDGSFIDACAEHQWVTWDHAARGAFRRSPYEDATRFPAEWPDWRLRRRRGGQDLRREVVEEALRLNAAGMPLPEVARRLGVHLGALVKYARAGRFVERQPVAQEDSPGPEIRTTDEIVRTLSHGRLGDASHCIPNCGPLILPEARLPINPYVLGVWLGAGDLADATLASVREDGELFDILRSEGCPVDEPDLGSSGISGRYRLGSAGRIAGPSTGRMRSGGRLGTQLRRAGLLYNKHVPAAYLRASAAQRLALLRGLMDAAGGLRAPPSSRSRRVTARWPMRSTSWWFRSA